MGLYLNR